MAPSVFLQHIALWVCVHMQMNPYFGLFFVEGLRCSWLSLFLGERGETKHHIHLFMAEKYSFY